MTCIASWQSTSFLSACLILGDGSRVLGAIKEIKRRAGVATLFSNEQSLLRLVIAILMEINDDWAARRIYLRVSSSELAKSIYRNNVVLSFFEID